MKRLRSTPAGTVQAGLAWIGLALLMPAVVAAAPTRSTLRVGLWTLWHDREVTVSALPGGSATLRSCVGCPAELLRQAILIRASGDQVARPGTLKADSILLEGALTLTAHGETLTLRNAVKISASKGELSLSVTLPVETYVARVVASEGGAADSLESLKALAIVVRSFALHLGHGHAEYDLCDSTHCQLLHWAGNGDRAAAAHAATLATAGETLWFRGRRAEAWFHQNCGGRTAAPAEVWQSRGAGETRMPWLVSRADSYCTAGGAREWSADLSRAELTRALAGQGLAAPGWTTLAVTRRGESGRAMTLRAGMSQFSAEEFRLAVGRTLGWNRILSTWFEIVAQGDRLVFRGRGSGHGVGLCQAGASAMAGRGRDAAQILAQYFPGANAADEATGRNWNVLQGQGFVLETLDAGEIDFLPALNQALAEAQARSGLRPAGPVTVRAFGSTTAFRDATLAPGWVAAFTEGRWIGTQPLKTLAARKLLGSTMRHEFLHMLVEQEAGAATPLWLREGLVEAWSGDAGTGSRDMADGRPAVRLDDLDALLRHAPGEAAAGAAHRAAQWYAGSLIRRFGREQVMCWLRSGVPAGALASLR